MAIKTVLAASLLSVSMFSFADGVVNINTAGLKTLTTLEQVGKGKAQKIIDYREEHGPFKHIKDLAKVFGIGKKTVEVNSDNISVELPASVD